MKKLFIILSILVLFSCEEEESEQRKLISQMEGNYTNTEWSYYWTKCDITCKWVMDTIIRDDPEYNFSINVLNDEEIEIDLVDWKINANNFEELQNGIAGNIYLQNTIIEGDIYEIKGYNNWEDSKGENHYSLSYNNNIIDFYYEIEDILLTHIRGVKE